MITFAIRMVLLAVLMVPVYFETGPWTVVALLLVAFAIEIESHILRKLTQALCSMPVSASEGTARSALEFYAKEENYYGACVPLQDDFGQRAKSALSALDGSAKREGK